MKIKSPLYHQEMRPLSTLSPTVKIPKLFIHRDFPGAIAFKGVCLLITEVYCNLQEIKTNTGIFHQGITELLKGGSYFRGD